MPRVGDEMWKEMKGSDSKGRKASKALSSVESIDASPGFVLGGSIGSIAVVKGGMEDSIRWLSASEVFLDGFSSTARKVVWP